MGILGKIKGALRGQLDDLLDRDRDPEEAMEGLIVEIGRGLDEARLALAKGIAVQKQLEAQRAHHAGLKALSEAAARAASAVLDDTVIRTHLEKAREQSAIVEGFGPELARASAVVAELSETLRLLEEQRREAQARLELLVAGRREAAIRKAVAMATEGLTHAAVARKGAAGLAPGIAVAAADSGPLAQEFSELAASGEIEAELAALKEKIRRERKG